MNTVRKFSAPLYIVLGALLAIGPQTLFKTCPTIEKVMKCYWTGRALIVVGALLVLVGLLKLIHKNADFTLDIVALALAISGIFLPISVIGGCAKLDMACRTTAFPAVYIVCAITVVVAIFTLLPVKKSEQV